MPPRIRSPALPSCISSYTPSARFQCPHHPSPQTRPFSNSTPRASRLRRRMFAWLQGPGRAFKEPLPGSTNYLGAYDRSGALIRGRGLERRAQGQREEGKHASDGAEDEAVGVDALSEEKERLEREAKEKREGELPPETLEDLRPFPLNREFRSQAVLSEELREAIWERVVKGGESVRGVSAALGVAMERVAAVVRLKEVEREWVKKNKPLALPYARAVLAMLPQTPLDTRIKPRAHESINDLPVHQATTTQLFHPVSESRHFTRVDAGLVFDSRLPLLPADARIPHPELVAQASMTRTQAVEAQKALDEKEKEERKQREEKRKKREARDKVVQGRRWDFVFHEVSVESVGEDGRSARGVGWRYGFPHEDRKRGQVKIPRRVEA
ncbi:hypothetical protein W97_04872 [Coniosporium apollinis CBS 100218]|uniref:Ribosomal protein S35, mitochondrial n=1 Tax=Coniosporium apollinis (strain CBS 100218) TaxID=1168221 RepID=R7YUX4_CONA1|nr:uncharacterized protein W97_04872 [Coniosporium apollinis CBS 100218]EON65633.1 hypothetical protein W97_04872 [Coniosporium apollinis CBS 100218]